MPWASNPTCRKASQISGRRFFPLMSQLVYGISVLETALKEIETTRALPPATYEEGLRFLDLVRTVVLKAPRLETKNDSSPNEVKLDDQFVASLEEAKAKLEDAIGDFGDSSRLRCHSGAMRSAWSTRYSSPRKSGWSMRSRRNRRRASRRRNATST